MKKFRSLISIIVAAIIAVSPICTCTAFAADADELGPVVETVEQSQDESEASNPVDAVEQGISESETVQEDSYVDVAEAEESVSDVTEISLDAVLGDSDSDEAVVSVFAGEEPDSVGGANATLENSVSNTYKGTVSDNLTVVLRGLTADNQDETFDAVNQYIAAILETGNTLTIKGPDYIDAEKYSLAQPGYDSNHCWAATASNILWTTGYAQDIENPLTLQKFQSEDELLTYFSENFTDAPGRPGDAVSWLFNGTYPLQDADGAAHVKEGSEGAGSLVPSITMSNLNSLSYLTSLLDDARDMSRIYNLKDDGMGVLVRWLVNNNGKNELSLSAHWATIAGAVLDDSAGGINVFDRVKAIILADSDNTPVNGSNFAAGAYAERTSEKRNQTNSYTVYKVVFDRTFNAWAIENFYGGTGIITHLYGLANKDSTGFGGADADDSGNVRTTIENANSVSAYNQGIRPFVESPVNIKNVVNEQNESVAGGNTEDELYTGADSTSKQPVVTEDEVIYMLLQTLTEKDLEKKDNIDALVAYMVTYKKPVFLLNDGQVNATKNYSCYVSGVDTMLYNLKLDGEMVPFNAFKIVEAKGGVSKLVLKKEYLAKLSKGKHEIMVSVQGLENPIKFIITIM